MVVGCPVVLQAQGAPVIWISEDTQGRSLFNFSIRGLDGRQTFEMRDNDWIAHPGWEDVEIGSEARSLFFSADKMGVRLRIHFREAAIGDVLMPHVRPMIPGEVDQLVSHLGFGAPSENALVCTVTGRIEALHGLVMNETESKVRGCTMGGNFMGRCAVAISI